MSYPLAAAAAVFVGIVEAFASFWASSFKEIIVFMIIIPVLLVRSLTTDPHRGRGVRRMRQPRPRSRPRSCVGALFPLLPGVPVFWVTLLNNVGLGALVAIGLVVLTGVGGLTSFGQAAFCGFGAFTTAVLTTRYGWSPWLTLPVALVITGGAALMLGLLTMRLSRPLSAARHHRLGPEPLLPVRRAGAVPPP